MIRIDRKSLHSLAMALALTLTAAVTTVLPSPGLAQTRTLPDFTDLVEQVGPSVVNIRTLEKVSARTGSGGDEEMLEFFKRFGLPMPNAPRQAPRPNRPQPQEEEQPRGVGSGFILSSDGLIMTNAHVIEGADEVIVTLTDKREFKAKLIGADKRSDVALVKIEASGLPAGAIESGAHIGSAVLRGYAIQEKNLVLYWEAGERAAGDGVVFVHLFDAQGNFVAGADGRPRNGGYSTLAWQAREGIVDAHSLPDVPAGTYMLKIGMYDAVTQVRFAVSAADGAVLPDGILSLGAITMP